MDDQNNIIEEQLNSLPPAIREALETVPWKDIVANIAKKENLDQNQSDVLDTEVMLVLYGFTDIEQLPNNLVAQIKIPSEQAVRIAKAIETEILPILEEKYSMLVATTSDSVKAESTTQSRPVSSQANERSIPISKPSGLPMVEEGQNAHETTPEEKAFMSSSFINSNLSKVSSSAPINKPTSVSYPAGMDPYREPMK